MVMNHLKLIKKFHSKRKKKLVTPEELLDESLLFSNLTVSSIEAEFSHASDNVNESYVN